MVEIFKKVCKKISVVCYEKRRFFDRNEFGDCAGLIKKVVVVKTE